MIGLRSHFLFFFGPLVKFVIERRKTSGVMKFDRSVNEMSGQ